jgi:hypothetical protein
VGYLYVGLRQSLYPGHAVARLRHEWEALAIKKTERAVSFNDRFREMRAKLDAYAPLPADRLLEAYESKIQNNKEVANTFAFLASLHPSWSLKEFMNHVATSDTIQHGSSSGGGATNKGPTGGNPTRSTLKKMDDKGGEVTSGPEMVCYKCQGKGHPARNCPVDVQSALRELAEFKRQKEANKGCNPKGGNKGGNKGGAKTTGKAALRTTVEGAANEKGEVIKEEFDDDVNLSDSGNEGRDH